jgi:hypothetical protein
MVNGTKLFSHSEENLKEIEPLTFFKFQISICDLLNCIDLKNNILFQYRLAMKSIIPVRKFEIDYR